MELSREGAEKKMKPKRLAFSIRKVASLSSQ